MEAAAAAGAKELVKQTAGDVYQDTFALVAKQIGKGLETGGRLVNAILTPIEIVCDLVEFGKSKFAESFNQKAKEIPEDRIQEVPPLISMPILQNAILVDNEPDLREMYATLLANAMDSESADNAHPAFAEIIRQMTPDEARIFKFLANEPVYPVVSATALDTADNSRMTLVQNLTCFPDSVVAQKEQNIPDYIDNLKRLNLIEVRYQIKTRQPGAYDGILECATFKACVRISEQMKKQLIWENGIISYSHFGKSFYNACVENIFRDIAEDDFGIEDLDPTPSPESDKPACG